MKKIIIRRGTKICLIGQDGGISYITTSKDCHYTEEDFPDEFERAFVRLLLNHSLIRLWKESDGIKFLDRGVHVFKLPENNKRNSRLILAREDEVDIEE